MKVCIRSDSVEIEGYVNAIERDSKPLMSRIGRFIERICKGAFSNALKRNDDVHLLLNHNWDRDLGSTKQGNLELREDSIGLHARAVITDPDVIDDARHGNLVGWSFGFLDTPDGVIEARSEDGLPLRKVKDMDLREVSILNRKKSPAYDGNLITVRSDEEMQYRGEDFMDDLEITEETKETREQPQMQDEKPVEIDYSKYEDMILDMKGDKS